ncbi:hypothetical protein [Methylophilus sp. YYY-1]|uniref:hypothetical protein n=1 Tax=Methylophilus sp. YYY-1 TaxID=2682087 RepID=UPI0023B2B15F|nr:hypothetical protein [Methylophilus sp. YYY-1]MDF0378842.1 hypothetical protein [Methylophilus sp. YYY-1]
MKSARMFSALTMVWLLRRAAWYLGWLPMLVSVLLLILWGVLSQQQSATTTQITLLTQAIQQLESQPIAPVAKVSTTIVKPEVSESAPEYLAALWQQLPEFADLSPRMMQIARLAQKRQMALNVGDYQWQLHAASDATQEIQQYDMRFNIQTDYLTCRQFIVDVLRQYPAMALTGLEFRKNETMQPMLDATLTFSVFIRGGRKHGS